MTQPAAERLLHLVNTIPEKLSAIDEMEFSLPPSPGKWSKKQILGHLIDSATNNHHRFIRVQYEDTPVIFYDQNKWNTLNHYDEIAGKQLISLWETYNRHLVEVITRIPKDNLSRKCNSGNVETVTLAWLVEDYVVHLEHHLRQLVAY